MKKFSDMGIKPSDSFVGDSIKIEKLLGKEIIVCAFRIAKSKFDKNESGNCLHLQIEYKGEKYVVFTGSDRLMSQIGQVGEGDFPFSVTIDRAGRCFEFK